MSFSPPLLLGTSLQFQSTAQLEWFARHEMSEERLTILGSQLTLFAQLEVTVHLMGHQIGQLVAMPVHQEADVYGLQLVEVEIDANHLNPDFLKPGAPVTAPVSAVAPVVNEVMQSETLQSHDGRESVRSTAADHEIAAESPIGPPEPKTTVVESKPSIPTTAASINSQEDEGDFGGLLLDRYEDDAERFDVEAPWIKESQQLPQQLASEVLSEPVAATTISQAAQQQSRDGSFSRVTLLGGLDETVLMGMLMRSQTRCEVGELTLHSSESLWTLYTDRSGRLCFDDATLERIERKMPRRRVVTAAQKKKQSQKKSQVARIKDALTHLLTELSEQDFLHYRFLPRGASTEAVHQVPFTVYICDVLLNLLKHHRLEEFKTHYQSRIDHYVEAARDTPITAADYALDRRAERFFEIISQEEHSLRMLFKVSPVSQGETYRLVRLGELLGLLSFSREKLTEVDLSEEHLVYLQQQFTRSKVGYFDALGIHMVTHPKLYASALETVQAKFSKDSEYAAHSYRHRELCAQVVRLAEEANRYLSDKKRRVTYRKANFDSTVLRQAADVLLEKADMNRLRGHDTFMREALEMALELDPNLTRQHIQRQRELETLDPSSSD